MLLSFLFPLLNKSILSVILSLIGNTPPKGWQSWSDFNYVVIIGYGLYKF